MDSIIGPESCISLYVQALTNRRTGGGRQVKFCKKKYILICFSFGFSKIS